MNFLSAENSFLLKQKAFFKSQSFLRYALVGLFGLGIVALKIFSLEFYLVLRPVLKSVVGLSILKTLNSFSPFNLNNVDLYIKILYILFHFLCLFSLVWMYFLSTHLFKLVLKIVAIWFVVSLSLNILGKLIHSKEILSTAHYSIDYLFSPLVAAFVLPVLTLAKQSNPKKFSN